MLVLRSLAFNLVYYLVTAVMVVGSLPIFLLGSEGAREATARAWARIGLFLLRILAGTKLELRGLEHIPHGGAIIAGKHQSMFETFALFPVLDRPTYVMKRELGRIPLWGWYAERAGMIMVERDQGTAALRRLAGHVGEAVARGRQVVIFPEGTRRNPGAPPDYKGGVAHLYRMTGAPVVPFALNSGVFWPRRRFIRHPGTIVIEFLPAIPPGLTSRDFLARLSAEIESASDRLLAETVRQSARPPDGTAERIDRIPG